MELSVIASQRRKILSCGIPFLIVLLSCFSVMPVFADNGSILLTIEKSSRAVVEVNSLTPLQDARPGLFTRKGAGIILNQQGVIVTNAHTVLNSRQISVRLYNGEEIDAKLVCVLKEKDLAFVQTRGSLAFVNTSFADSNNISLNDTVYTIGSSEYLDGTITSGTIIGLGRKSGEGANIGYNELIQVDFGVYKGDSGTPLYDKSGRLLGIMAFSEARDSGKSFAIPVNTIRQEYLRCFQAQE